MRSSILLAAAVAALPFVVASPAQAAKPAVQIVKVYYDSPGSDRGGNTSVNGEYVVLRNNTSKHIQMERWILRDKAGYKYRFPRFTLRAGKQVTVRSGQGSDGTSTLYWGRAWYVWNNTGDSAGVYRASDLKKIHACSWGRSSRAYVNC